MADSLLSTPGNSITGYTVQLGIWTNWSRGSVLGPTLTLSRKHGSLLIAFTAFFITIVATRFWRIACSVIHRGLSVVEPRDALHFQRQAIFRNSTSSESALWSLMQISWAWRRLDHRCLVRTLPSISFAAICLLAFAFASGFSSSISTAIGDEVLIDGTHCGFLDFTTLETDEITQIFDPWEASTISNGVNYASQVYSPSSSTGAFDSTKFAQRILRTEMNNKAPCPFKDTLCRLSSSNLVLDSGFIDIGYDLGVNFQPDRSMLYRQVLHCAPLVTKGRKKKTTLNGLPNYTTYSYGGARWIIPTNESTNYTFSIKDIQSQYTPESTSASPSYSLSILRSLRTNGTNSKGEFIAERDLQRVDADTYLIFLSGNGVVSSTPLNDPWYRFHDIANFTIVQVESNEETFSYQPTEAASPLGCAYQVQICKGGVASEDSCGPLASYSDAWGGAAPLFGVDTEAIYNLETYQLVKTYAADESASRFIWLLRMITNSQTDITDIVTKIGSQSLESSKSLVTGIQGPLPEDQWMLDVTYWWNITLAVLQATFVDTAYGSTTPESSRLQINATNAGQASICQNQKIRSTDYVSISVFGLHFTYIIGFLIIIASLVIDPLFTCAQKRWKYREYENLEWISNETLQLQRLAYDESGQGEWSKCTDTIPITVPDQKLGSLNLTNLEHPRLSHPRSPRSSKDIPMSSLVIQGRNENNCNHEELGVNENDENRSNERCEQPLEQREGRGSTHGDSSRENSPTTFAFHPRSPM
ncbi:hypothetical protein F5B22DRAFT_654790 [Xylaria bambusicola]|uniref:uncharacterized protein n=1 Tax=Xylaria bambusicola TaxID=326684 RepID=UPI002007AC1E|nr:uncharacterized protein F5B22DRAFT_654790 [Xylaria bambusicola]KAI0517573.1 hypothetical protein F5B22DRAFT_654790 [Xylaria bambusicola]